MTGQNMVHAPRGPGSAQLLGLARYGTYYEVLGLTRDAAFAAVARRARELILLLDSAAEEQAVDLDAVALEDVRWSVREAWRVLSNPELRERYSLGLARLNDDIKGGHHGPSHG